MKFESIGTIERVKKSLCLMIAPVPDFINGKMNSDAAIDKIRSCGRKESEAGYERQEEKRWLIYQMHLEQSL